MRKTIRPVCLYCGSRLSPQRAICDECEATRARDRPKHSGVCSICGVSVTASSAECGECSKHKFVYSEAPMHRGKREMQIGYQKALGYSAASPGIDAVDDAEEQAEKRK